jgi:hypothetical protein
VLAHAAGLALVAGLASAMRLAEALAAGLGQTAGPALAAELAQSAGPAARWAGAGGAVQLAAAASG